MHAPLPREFDVRCWALDVSPQKRSEADSRQPRSDDLGSYSIRGRLVIHAAHAAVTTWSRSWLFLLRNLGDQAFGGEQKPRDGSGVLQRRARYLLGIDHTG